MYVCAGGVVIQGDRWSDNPTRPGADEERHESVLTFDKGSAFPSESDSVALITAHYRPEIVANERRGRHTGGDNGGFSLKRAQFGP